MKDEKNAPAKLWGGRFSEPTDQFVERFTASIGFDARLYHHDIRGSIAHARMLAHTGVITNAERDQIVAGLGEVLAARSAAKSSGQWHSKTFT